MNKGENMKNKEIVQNTLNNMYDIERQVEALALISKHALSYSEDTLTLEDIKQNAIQYNHETEVLWAFMEENLKTLTKKIDANYNLLDGVRFKTS